jgi:membrane fusion protein (multidrug efflux system)
MKPVPSILWMSIPTIILICGCSPAVPGDPPKEAATPLVVQIARAKRGPIIRYIALPGEVKPYQQATLYAKVAGYLKNIAVDKGDEVHAGDLLAEIEVPEMLADRVRYKAEVEVAALDYQRLSESQKKVPDLVVPQTVDNAKAKLEVARASLEHTDALLGFAKITAPFSGVITRRMVDPGAFIPAATSGGSAENASIVTVTDFAKVRVQVAVPEIESSLVVKDQPVKLSVEGLPRRNFEGKITRFAYALDEGSKTMLTEIELPNPKLELRPGMYALVKIGLEKKDDALLVPVEAVLFEKAGSSVFGLADGKAKKVPVKTGFIDGANVEIISGITGDQPLILAGKKPLTDGQPVTIAEPK